MRLYHYPENREGAVSIATYLLVPFSQGDIVFVFVVVFVVVVVVVSLFDKELFH